LIKQKNKGYSNKEQARHDGPWHKS